jgi:serine/threonine protein kinase/TolB-like protein/Tfp pilus assembly protein PilF
LKAERNRQIDKVFQAALAHDPAERAAFLDEASAGDPGLRRDVEALLASDEQAGGFIESPALAIAPELVAHNHSTSVTGKTIGPYRLDSQLGAGGMGRVYLAHDQRLGRKVALKLLDPGLTADNEQRTRFLREARLAASLDHPNICTIHEVGEAAGRLFIAMQYVEGETLRRAIGGRPLTLDSLLSISLQVGDALAEAHARGIIHRDIKPGNIIITPRGQAKVLDFGLAKLLEQAGGEAETHLTMTGAVIGTPASMSPEQARGERADHRTDIFSFGGVLYEMSTGQTPFSGRSKADVISALLSQPHTPAAELNSEVPAHLSAVIDRALAKEPADRYQSMQEMIADLRQVIAEAGGMDHLFSSSEARLRVITPFVAPRRRSMIKLFGRTVQKSTAVAFMITVMAIVTVGLVGVSYRSWFKQPRPAIQDTSTVLRSVVPIKSIAVLPFKPLAAANRDEVLEIGMTDTLINRLSGMKEVLVRPISAVRKYADLEQDAVAAGREQQVDAVLDGSIQRSGERVRVTVRLVRVDDGSQLWGETFNEKFTDIFAVHDRVSEKVAGALALKLSSGERELLTKRYTENTEAYQLYLKGRYYWNKRTGDAVKKGIEYFNQAIQKDPTYALAYAGLADSYSILGSNGVIPMKESHPKARAAALKALEIDDNLAEAHTSLAAIIADFYWNWQESEIHFRRALELNPNYPTAHHWYCQYLVRMGRFDEAIQQARRAQELDPLSLVMNSNLGQTFYEARQYDQAIDQLQKTLEMDANFVPAYLHLGLVYLQKRMYDEAIASFQKGNQLAPYTTDMSALLGHAYAMTGKRDEALKILGEMNELSNRQYVSPYGIALIYVGLGEKDQTFKWLEKAYDDRIWLMGMLKVEPTFDPIRSDPRFEDLLRRVGLPQ